MLPSAGYQLLDATSDRAIYLAPAHGDEKAYSLVTVEAAAGSWSVTSVADCQPTAVVDDVVGAATWTWDPSAAVPGATATTFTALVSQTRCASGEPVGTRLRGPVIVVQSDRVLVGFAVDQGRPLIDRPLRPRR